MYNWFNVLFYKLHIKLSTIQCGYNIKIKKSTFILAFSKINFKNLKIK